MYFRNVLSYLQYYTCVQFGALINLPFRPNKIKSLDIKTNINIKMIRVHSSFKKH